MNTRRAYSDGDRGHDDAKSETMTNATMTASLTPAVLPDAEGALGRKPRDRLTVRSRAEDILSKLLPHGRATASEVARRLGLSLRTLSRKLGEEGTSFAEILDQLRPRQALSS